MLPLQIQNMPGVLIDTHYIYLQIILKDKPYDSFGPIEKKLSSIHSYKLNWD